MSVILSTGGVSQHALGQGVCVSKHALGQVVCTPPPPISEKANDTIGTHPTGMHSCLNKLIIRFIVCLFCCAALILSRFIVALKYLINYLGE